MHFTSFSTLDLDLKLILHKQVPDFHSPAPRKKSSSAIGSLGVASSRDRRNPAKGGPGLAGKVAGMMRDSSRVDLRGWKQREVLRRASSAVPWMGSRESFCSGE
jgi:hypothetical protein